MTEALTPAVLLEALGVVPAAEADQHLAQRMKRVATKIAKHLEYCENCDRESGRICQDALMLLVALSRAAASGQRYADCEAF